MTEQITCAKFNATMTQKSCDNYRFFNPEKCGSCELNAVPVATTPTREASLCAKCNKRPTYIRDLCKSCYNSASSRKTRQARKESGIKEVGRRGATITLHIHVATFGDVPALLDRIKAAVEEVAA